MDVEEIKIKLPRHLSTWLKEFSKAIAMTPDQFIANILSYYYEAWRIGKEWEIRSRSGEMAIMDLSIDSIVEKYLSINRKNKHILRHFSVWLKERGYGIDNLNDDLVKKFLDEYKLTRNPKINTIHTYRYVLKKFIKFVKAYIVK